MNFWNLNIKRQPTFFKNRGITSSAISLPLESKLPPQLSKLYNISVPSFSLENSNENYSEQLSDHSCASSIYDEHFSPKTSNYFVETGKDVLEEGMLKFTAEDYIQEIQQIQGRYLSF